MPAKTGFTTEDRDRRSIYKETQFELKWGERAEAIARRENVRTATIHMRVHNYGSPYQRYKTPNQIQLRYGKTTWQIAVELGITPITVFERWRKHKDVYWNQENPQHNRGTGDVRKMSGQYPNFFAEREWLMPEHPNYCAYKKGMFYNEDK
tara:strand:+ start:7936 stop:8388 length:453 start_codon:yes stop_codon:yes gene_type:complete